MSGLVIAIDGPAGTGKSTVAREVARRLGLAYLDTGATYRAGTVACMREGVDLDNHADVAAMLATMNVELRLDPVNPRVELDGEDISRMIRMDTVSLLVSRVATNLEARAVLREWQQAIVALEVEGGFSAGRGIVLEGRDVTTVIAPDAPVRVLMTARDDVRVARRAGEGADAGTVREAVLGRDAKDSTVVNFTEAVDGVHTLDTSDMTIDDAVQAVLSLAEAARSQQ